MGLDWIVLDKPKQGCQIQFNTLTELLAQTNQQLNELDENSPDFDQTLEQYEQIKSQLASVSISKYDTTKCPKVGTSKKAKEYFISKMLPEIKKSHPTKSDEEIINDFSDYRIVELSPYKKPKTGFYGIMCSSLDFRGKGIGFANLLDENLRNEAYEDHEPNEAIEYSKKLRNCLAKYNKTKLTEEEKEEYDFIMAGAKWLEFWGKNSHGFHAWY